MSAELKPDLQPAVKILRGIATLAILNREEHILFHRMLTQRLMAIKQSETKRGTITQMQIDQAVQIAKLQAKIERGLVGDLDIPAEGEQRMRLVVADEQLV